MSSVRRAAVPAVISAGLSSVLAATVLSQHPLRTFDRVRAELRSQFTLPDWRFFAPEPGRWDWHIMYRVRYGEEPPSQWHDIPGLATRAWRHTVWFPDHRHEKALVDLASSIQTAVRERGSHLSDLPPYRLLDAHVQRVVSRTYPDRAPSSYQWLLLRDAGYDTRPDPEYILVSPMTPFPADVTQQERHAVRTSSAARRPEATQAGMPTPS